MYATDEKKAQLIVLKYLFRVSFTVDFASLNPSLFFKSRKEIWLHPKTKEGISEKQTELANNVPDLTKNISTNK
ncbi:MULTISPECIES: hypothetical protein [Acinetobacter]|uniref:hypothetical protein n=1 Tax=Acinetobacter TaxID=469 RepID=UPI00044E9D2D|nr:MULTISPECIES: hypothetical protein [Acinetobacter]AUX88922.1 hypothetical protein C3F22_03180 [Acinetobacter sp. ACNIH1]EXA68820.1 hypothetical protein J504_0054 [Acinetobacter baumannii 348935]MCU4364507.1 hypothetical protein [Acinetobacter variabilis]MCU4374462.1 hypothetical protein [Acinetobacter variabilis]